MKGEDLKKVVREEYGAIARSGSSCCGPAQPCCCGSIRADEVGLRLGYSREELESVPEGANLGLGCGNPVALASLREGETVLDLGSGSGLDCFLAARRVGEKGRVIGVDMTPEMLERIGRTRGVAATPTWSSGWGRSRTYRWPTLRWTWSSPTA